jgi:osmoprotectant transport system permease protein
VAAFPVIASVFIDAFRFIPDNASLLLTKAGQTAGLAFAAFGIGIALALPLGLWLGHKHRGLFVALGISSVGRAVPSIVLIGFAITAFNLGFFWDNATALIVLAIPPILANSFFAVAGVDADAVEAARGMGLTETQILVRVELPLGLPLILAGLRIAAVFVIATATIAGIVGGGGLGAIIANPSSYGDAGVLGASYCVAAIALCTAGGLALLQRAAFRRMSPTA